MLIIGLILFAAAVVVGVDIASINDAGVDVESFGRIFSSNAGAVFVAGFVTALVACLGLLLIGDGLARARRRRAERKEIEAERDHLVREAERARAARIDAEGSRDRAVDDSNLDLRDRPAERASGHQEVAADEQLERPRHRLLHRSDR